MLCQNCGKNEANIRYTQIVNGVKKEMALCSECAEKLGVENPSTFFEDPARYHGLAAEKSRRIAKKYAELMK